MITFKTTMGDIQIELDHDKTPKTASNFQKLAEDGHYKDTIFHRVIDGFMIQGGGFGSGMSSKDAAETIENEAKLGGSNVRGTLAMARTPDPHSASSQFFINVKDNLFLDFKSETPDGYGYCVFGRVVKGMDVVDAIKAVKTGSKAGHQDVPLEDILVEEVLVEA